MEENGLLTSEVKGQDEQTPTSLAIEKPLELENHWLQPQCLSLNQRIYIHEVPVTSPALLVTCRLSVKTTQKFHFEHLL